MAAHSSPTVKLFLQEATPGRALCIASLKRAPSAADRERIAQTGCTLRNAVGNIVTLACDRASLARLIDWDGVRSVELSTPLYPE